MIIHFQGKLIEANGVPVEGASFSPQMIDAETFTGLVQTAGGYRLHAAGWVFAVSDQRREELEVALRAADVLVGPA